MLETRFETAQGTVLLIDAMGRREGHGDVVRLVRGESRVGADADGACAAAPATERSCPGSAAWPTDGASRRWRDRTAYVLDTPDCELQGEDMKTVGEFTAEAGSETPFTLTWSPSYHPVPTDHRGQRRCIDLVTEDWRTWAKSHRSETAGDWSALVLRSLITLKALTHFETGGIVAAPTTSLPEQLGGPRNWDYRLLLAA